jgi:hypothetical protein
MPQTVDQLTLSKKLMLAVAGYPVNSIEANLPTTAGEAQIATKALRGDGGVYDASICSKYKEVAQREQPQESIAGFARKRTAVAGF